jgi:uncharacterized protein DUF6056
VQSRSSRLLGIVALAGLGAPLVVLAVGGLFSRYAADDYCTAGQVQLAGFLEAQSRLYVGWSGRFAATLLVTLVDLVGPAAVPVLPALALLAWLATATWAARELSQAAAFGWRLPLLPSAVLAMLVVFATLQTTADLPQVLYWQTGMLTYLAPLLLATAYVGWVTHFGHSGEVRWPAVVGVSFALTFVAGGTSETFAAAQLTGLLCASAIAYTAGARTARSKVQASLLAGLLGATLALLILAVAPGNSVRQETGAQTPLAIALPQALEFTQGWLRLTFARPHAAVLLLLVAVPAAIGAATPRPKSASLGSLVLAAWVVATALVILACMLPAFYALGSNPPGRAQVIPQYVLVCSLAALGWLLGTVTASRLGPILRSPASAWVAAGAVVVLLGLGPLLMARDIIMQITPARAYAVAWDQLDGEVRAERHQGVQDVTVRSLTSTGMIQNLDFVGPNRDDWFNACVARYYDLNTIASTLSVP